MGSLLDNIHFETLSESLSRLPDAIKSIPDILRNPAANPLQAAIVLGIAVVLVLIVLLSVVLLFVQREPEFVVVRSGSDSDSEGEFALEPKPARPKPTRAELAQGTLTAASLVLIMFVALWVVTGVSTSASATCTGCHSTSAHSTAPASDPHGSVECVQCHETGGTIERLTINLPARIQHFAFGRSNPVQAAEYGVPIPSGGCRQCHEAAVSAIGKDPVRGLRVSHKEPLAAGAECVDCHKLFDGQVLARTVGMEPCLRCHDGTQAKAKCSECHDGDPARAILAKTPTNSMASQLVPTPPCGACHFNQSRCDNCHGVRMPHTQQFMLYGHAKEGALSVWDTGNARCGKCHYQGHRACNQAGCHIYKFPQHALSWKTDHQAAMWSQADNICGCHGWYTRQHQGLNFCQVCHPTKPPGTRP